MSTYFDDWESYSTGSLPTGWTARFNENDTFTVETTGSDKYLQLADPDSLQFLSWDTIDSDSDRDDAQVLIEYQLDASASLKPSAFARGSGTGSNLYAYRAGGSTSTFGLYKYVNSSSSTSLTTVSFTAAADTKYWIRFEVIGTTVRGRIWEDGVSEPSGWTGTGTGWAAVTTTDSNVTAAGWVGVGSISNNLRTYKYWQIGVGTNGDTAPSSGGAAAASTPPWRSFPRPILNF